MQPPSQIKINFYAFIVLNTFKDQLIRFTKIYFTFAGKPEFS